MRYDTRCREGRLSFSAGLGIAILLIAFLLPADRLGAQSLSLFDIDLTNFPEVSARIVALDQAGEPIQGLSDGEFTITENGRPVQAILQVDCPPPLVEEPMSVVLVNDRSGSMTTALRGGRTRMELLKLGTIAFIDLFSFKPPGAVAVTAFDSKPLIVSDFRTSAPPLLTAINDLTADGGTHYTPAFLDPVAGGINMLKGRPANVRRVLVFLTDGEPNIPPATDSIIDEAKKAKVEIHVITIGLRLSADLKRMAEETGGTWHDDVASETEMEGIYRQIALTSRGMKPCTIRWMTEKSCGFTELVRNVTVAVPSRSLTAEGRYTVPLNGIVRLETDPGFLWFGEAAPPATVDRGITITARGGAFQVTAGSITAGLPFTITDWGGTEPPFTLAEGDSRTIAVRFTPTDTAVFTGEFRLESLPCSPSPVVLTGGLRGSTGTTPLQLISPIGGETFDGCDTIAIRWAGVSATDSVMIEYTDDDGANWRKITDTARNFSYLWKPPSPGTRYRIRISTKGDPATLIERVAGGGLGGDNGQANAATLVVPNGLAVSNGLLYIAEAGGNRIRRVNLSTGIITTVAGTGSPGNSGDGGAATSARLYDPNSVVVAGDRMYIADYSNNRIREVDLTTGIIRTLAGTGESGFSGDSGLAINAMLREPIALAMGPGALYFTDRNYLVRKIDLTTEIITTVAGAGLNQGDGGFAYRAFLSVPEGIAIQGRYLYIAESGRHKIRRVDLTTGIITTVAGTGEFGGLGDGGLAVKARLYAPTGVDAVGGSLYITDGNNHRIRRVDLTTGIITALAGSVRGNQGDGGPPGSARMDFPSSPIVAGGKLFFSDMRNNTVRSVSLGRQPGLDSSHATFTVATPIMFINPNIAGRSIDMGKMAMGESGDSMIVSTICNNGTAPLVISSLVVSGNDPSDFIVVSGGSADEILPGSCRSIEIRFRPTALGSRSALLIVNGECAGSDTIRLSGTAVEPCDYTYTSTADLGSVLLNTIRPDTTLTAVLCNTGTTPLSGDARISTRNSSFRIIAGEGPFTLGPGACHNITIRFTARAVGRQSAELEYNIPGYCGAARTILIGRGGSQREIVTADAVAFPTSSCSSSAFDTTIIIRNAGGLPLLIHDARITENNEGFSILPPLPSAGSPMIIEPDGIDSIVIRFNPATAGSKSGVLELASDDPDSPTRIPLSGRLDSFSLTVVDPTVSFGSPTSSVPFPRDTFVVVENSGSGAIEITAGTIEGDDRSKFEITAGQLPIRIEPGETTRIHVRALAPAIDSSWRGTLRLAYGPSCDSGAVTAALVVPGAEPALIVTGPNFQHLFCPDDVSGEAEAIVRNEGGKTLEITGHEIRNDAEGNFELITGLPISIEPGEQAVLRLSFKPKSPGARSAELLLFSNGEQKQTIVRLTSIRDSLAFDISETGLDFGSVPVGEEGERKLTVRNTGTYPINWETPRALGPFLIVSAEPATAAPGEESTITVVFRPTTEGIYHDTIDVREVVCGVSHGLALSGVAGELTTSVVSLPVQTATIGTPVGLPIRFSIPDMEAFRRIGADSFATSIRFSGNILRIDSADGAVITGTSTDRKSGDVTISLKGAFNAPASDTLALIHAMPLLGDRMETPLLFTFYAWNRWNALSDTVNGLLTLTGDCHDAGFVLATAPKVLKISPQPVRGSAAVVVEMKEWLTLRVSLVNDVGVTVATIAEGRYDAGVHTIPLDLPDIGSGVYSIVLESPFSRVVERVVVVR